MATGLVLDQLFTRHDTGPGHPERPARVQAIADAFEEARLSQRCQRLAPEAVELERLLTTHSRSYVERLQDHCRSGQRVIDCPDSAIGPESYDIARLATGAVLQAARQIAEGTIRNAFCALRPPGHHAERDVSMGFCMFNHIAVAAHYLMAEHGVERIAILDWDVHHGNGTQHAFDSDPRVFFCSMHGHPSTMYPGTGFEHERGTGAGEGTTLNLPMMPGAEESDYRSALQERFLPEARAHQPQFILVSAGFDAHRADPLGPINLETSSFGWLTREVLALADEACAGRLLSVLEGGYDLEALGESAAIHLEHLLNA